MRYQETWIDGRADAGHPFQRHCDERYAPIRDFLGQYRRPFSVFDLGANMGYFSFRIAEDFDAVCVMADDKAELPELCRQNAAGRKTILLHRRMPANVLAGLAACEHFDVVLALNVLHHMADWRVAAEALVRLGDHLIVETPGRGDTNAANSERHGPILDFLSLYKPDHLGAFASHTTDGDRPLMRISLGKSRLTQQTVDAGLRKAPPLREVRVASDFTHKTIEIKHGDISGVHERRDFIHGMNLWNWKLLGGVWPQAVPFMVEAAVKGMKDWHDDLMPWNFILDGACVRPIDFDTKLWKTAPAPDDLDRCLSMIR